MKAKEREELILKGEPLEVVFGIAKIYYSLGGKRITKEQFRAIKEKFKDRLDFNPKEITTHTYTIKKGVKE